jgi:hypothetical protein
MQFYLLSLLANHFGVAMLVTTTMKRLPPQTELYSFKAEETLKPTEADICASEQKLEHGAIILRRSYETP